MHFFIVSYLNTFSDYCKTVLRIIKKKKVCFLSLVLTPVCLVLTPSRLLGFIFCSIVSVVVLRQFGI